MKTEELIADLASRATPVRPLPTPVIRLASWLAIATACAVGGVLTFGARQDITVRLLQPDFAWTLVVGATAAALAGLAALVLAIPGAERSPALRIVTVSLLAAWAAGLIAVSMRGGIDVAADHHWPACFARVVAVALVPAGVLLLMIRRAAPLHPSWTGWLLAVAALAAGAIAVQIVCPIDDPAHALIGHLAPVVPIGAMAAAGGRRLFGTT